MYAKPFITMLFVIVLSTVGLISCNIVEQRFSVDSVQHPALAKLVKMRCTRRFSPGVCVENVAPVWTFTFLQQNCTERLGCPNNFRTNRFPSYRMCIKRCRPLVEMYLKMVEFEEKMGQTNDPADDSWETSDPDDRNLRGGVTDTKYSKPTASKTEVTIIPESLEDLSSDLEEEEYRENEQDSRFIVYKESNVNEDIMLPDIDYVPGEIRSDMDLTHWG
ncbi:hypothetical protein PYW08_010605 [Mythimna loreyi]|uniref:Uncharacterized protein n=1 Tax=Mythimna loreyi TaxID=667449 RepID=A0ACC2Q8K8_9NEOP|nr:hypothetical protein PYW08_010605 [Mythimna loreyi]